MDEVDEGRQGALPSIGPILRTQTHLLLPFSWFRRETHFCGVGWFLSQGALVPTVPGDGLSSERVYAEPFHFQRRKGEVPSELNFTAESTETGEKVKSP